MCKFLVHFRMIHTIQYVQSNDIDLQKWDMMVDHNMNGRVFVFSWFLSAFCKWDAIILGDYEAGIPLPVSRLWGLRALLQPSFIQQCCWVGEMPNETGIKKIRQLIREHFIVVEFNSNLSLHSEVKKRDNLILDISNPKIVYGNYHKTLKKNLNKSLKNHTISYQENAAQTIQFYRDAYGHVSKHLTNEVFDRLLELIQKKSSNFINLHVFYNKEITASLLFAVGKDRLHYILGAPNRLGRKQNSLSVGIHDIITQPREERFILDFEGSSIPSVRNFYQSFGAVNEPFYEITDHHPLIKPVVKIYNKLFRFN